MDKRRRDRNDRGDRRENHVHLNVVVNSKRLRHATTDGFISY